MTNLSQLAHDVASLSPLTQREQRAELAVARVIVRETLEAVGLAGSAAEGIEIEMGTRLTSTMGKAFTHSFGVHQPLAGRIRLSASPLWRRATAVKRRNTVKHELAHIVANWRAGKRVGHSAAWKAEMIRMGESPTRCHSVPAVPSSRRTRRPTSVDFLAQILGRRSASLANAAAVTERVHHRASFRVGDVVMFGKGRGEQTRARVERVNGKSLSLVTLEARGYDRHPAGSKFRASYALVRKVS
jgi:hypothetical protein